MSDQNGYTFEAVASDDFWDGVRDKVDRLVQAEDARMPADQAQVVAERVASSGRFWAGVACKEKFSGRALKRWRELLSSCPYSTPRSDAWAKFEVAVPRGALDSFVTTRRARVAVGLAAQGLSNFQIAEWVGVPVREVKFLVDHTLAELCVSSREELSKLL